MHLILTRTIIVTVLLQLAIFDRAISQVQPAKPMENVGQKSQKYSLGLRIGPTITKGHFPSNLADTVRNYHTNKPKLGFSVAGQLMFPLQKRYSCLIEVGYSRGGRKIKYNQNTWENDFTYNFLTTSLALRRSFEVQIKEGLVADWFINVGPNISYLLSGKGSIKTDNGGRSDFTLVFSDLDSTGWKNQRDGDFSKYYLNNVNRFFFGVDIGIGAYVPITNRQKLYTEVRLTLGQTFIGKKNSESDLNILNFSDPLSTNMKSINFSVVYTFDFDKKASKQGKSTLDKKRKPARRK